jgi:DNA repair exonuclease SbcCD nuclease subunit
MKVGIVSDTHFGYRRFEEDAERQGREAILSAAKECDLLLLPGDIFDTRVPRPETLASVVKILNEAAGAMRSRDVAKCAEYPFFPPIAVIHGTHERRARGLVNPIELLALSGHWISCHNKTVLFEKDSVEQSDVHFPKENASDIECKLDAEGLRDKPSESSLGCERIAISGLGGVPDDLAKEALAQMSCKPVGGAYNIFMLHQSFSEFIPSGAEMLSLEDLPQGFDMIVCGHMHAPHYSKKKPFLIPGSTVITQLREEEQGQKGYYVLDTEKKSAEFMPVKTRPFHFVKLEFSGTKPQDAEKRAKEAIEQVMKISKNEKPIIRLVLSGTLAEGFVSADLSSLQSADAFLQIDNNLASATLADRLAFIRELRAQKESARDFGMQSLRKKAQAAGLNASFDDDFFFELGAGPDAVFEKMKNFEKIFQQRDENPATIKKKEPEASGPK